MAGSQLLGFVDGPGGCGKTFTFNTILRGLRARGKVVLAVATTGIAALQLDGGKTVHSALKVPIDPNGGSRGIFAIPIKKNSALGQLILHHIDVLLWDEASMANVDLFDSLSDTFCKLREDDRPFGGISVLLGGDFRQCLPVIRGGTRAQQAAASILNSALFKHFSVFHLLTNVRVEQCKLRDPARSNQLAAWAEQLLRIGEGDFAFGTCDRGNEFESVLPSLVHMRPVSSLGDVHSMISSVFGDLSELSSQGPDALAADEAMHSAVLCPLHVSVDFINKCCLDVWQGDVHRAQGVDAYDNGDDAMVVTLEQLNSKTPGGSPPQILELKLYMPLVLLRNMKNGLMNGTRLLLLGIQRHVLQCRVLTGSKLGEEVYIPRFIFKHEGSDQPLNWSRRQFPVKPCWAMTITKSQAQTLTKVAVCLVQVQSDDKDGITVDPADAFSHGQIYVALSRCGDNDCTCIYTTAERFQAKTIKNVVYPEVLFHWHPEVSHSHTHDSVTQTSGYLEQTTPTDVLEDDLMYDARAHLALGPTMTSTHIDMDVPWHGYSFDNEGSTMWDGQLGSIDDILMNCADAQLSSFDIEDLLNNEMFD